MWFDSFYCYGEPGCRCPWLGFGSLAHSAHSTHQQATKAVIMKKKTLLLVCVLALSALPLWSADSNKETINAEYVQYRLRNIDLKVMLRQYKRVSTDLSEAELQVKLLEIEDGTTRQDRDKKAESLKKKIVILERVREALGHDAVMMGTELGRMSAVKAK